LVRKKEAVGGEVQDPWGPSLSDYRVERLSAQQGHGPEYFGDPFSLLACSGKSLELIVPADIRGLTKLPGPAEVGPCAFSR
jgi:hypothetical protein